jgi:hypothetical protein
MSKPRMTTFAEFWPYYVKEHRDPKTRRLHFVGTAAALATVATAVVTGKKKLLPLALVAGYGPAWFSHFFIEKNRPATFQYPLFSLAADFVMFGKMLAGTMDDEVARIVAEAEGTATEQDVPPVTVASKAADLSVN